MQIMSSSPFLRPWISCGAYRASGQSILLFFAPLALLFLTLVGVNGSLGHNANMDIQAWNERGFTSEAASSKCTEPKIKNSKPVPEGRFPYMASIKSSAYEHRCGGILITKSHVLTAAHCLLVVGFNPLLSIGPPYIQEGSIATGEKVIRAHTTYVHPSWNGSFCDGHDVAVLELKQEFNIPTPHLAEPNNYPKPGAILYALGFGKGGCSESSMKELQMADTLRAVRNKWCPIHNLTEGMVCAYSLHQNTCKGDSGGPLLQPDMMNAKLSKGVASRDLIMGVTSFGETCQKDGGAGAYVHVGSVRGWIESIMKAHGSPLKGKRKTSVGRRRAPDGAMGEIISNDSPSKGVGDIMLQKLVMSACTLIAYGMVYLIEFSQDKEAVNGWKDLAIFPSVMVKDAIGQAVLGLLPRDYVGRYRKRNMLQTLFRCLIWIFSGALECFGINTGIMSVAKAFVEKWISDRGEERFTCGKLLSIFIPSVVLTIYILLRRKAHIVSEKNRTIEKLLQWATSMSIVVAASILVLLGQAFSTASALWARMGGIVLHISLNLLVDGGIFMKVARKDAQKPNWIKLALLLGFLGCSLGFIILGDSFLVTIVSGKLPGYKENDLITVTAILLLRFCVQLNMERAALIELQNMRRRSLQDGQVPPLCDHYVPRSIEREAKEHLLNGTNVCLTGMPGSGKTTTAIAIVHNWDVLNNFEGGIFWVYAGDSMPTQNAADSHNRHAVCRRILELLRYATGSGLDAATDGNGCIDERHIEETRRSLDGRRHLLVLDHVVDQHVLSFAQTLGCSLLINTLTRDLNFHAIGIQNVNISPLSKENSLELFWKTQKCKDSHPFGPDLVHECRGHALSIAILGSRFYEATKDVTLGAHRAIDDVEKTFSDVKIKLTQRINPLLIMQKADRDRHLTLEHCVEERINVLTNRQKRCFYMLSIPPKKCCISLETLKILWEVDNSDELFNDMVRHGILVPHTCSYQPEVPEIGTEYVTFKVPNLYLDYATAKADRHENYMVRAKGRYDEHEARISLNRFDY